MSLQASIPTAATLALLALLASTAGFFWQRSRMLERDRDQARQVTRFLVDQFHLDPARDAHAETLSARDVLDRAAARIENGGVVVPEDRAALLGALGAAYLGVGADGEAERLLKWGLSLHRSADSTPDSDLVVSMLDLATVKRRQGLCEEGNALQAEAARMIDEHGLDDFYLRRFLDERAFSLNHRMGDPRLAEILYRLSSRLEPLRSPERTTTVARTYHHLAIALELQGKRDEAEVSLEQTLALRREAHGDDALEVRRTLDALEALQRNAPGPPTLPVVCP